MRTNSIASRHAFSAPTSPLQPEFATVTKFSVNGSYALARIEGSSQFVLLHMTVCRRCKEGQFSKTPLNLTPRRGDKVVFIRDPLASLRKPRGIKWGYESHWGSKGEMIAA